MSWASTSSRPSGAVCPIERADIGEVGQAIAAVERAVKRLGGLDIVCNAAGIMPEGTLADLDLGAVDRLFAVNVRGTIVVAKTALPHLGDGGRIVNIASELAYLGRAGFSAYCATKGAILSLTRSWARELAPRILVNAVAPGPTDTPLLDFANLSPEMQALETAQPARSHRAARGDRRGGRFPRRPGRDLHHRTMHRRRRRRRHALRRKHGRQRLHGRAFLARVRAKVAARVPVIIPLGATEQHGPHLPLNVDVVLPTGVAERVATEVGGLVAPTIPYGYKSQPRSGGGQAFPGTTSLDAQTFALVLRDIIRDLAAHGVRRIVVLNGHFENTWPSVEGVDLGLREAAPRRHRRHAGASPRILGLRPPRDARQALPGRLPRHRARACEPPRDLADAAPPPRPRRHGQGALRRSGEIPDLRHAAAPPAISACRPRACSRSRMARRREKGSWLMNDHVELIAAAIRKEFSL